MDISKAKFNLSNIVSGSFKILIFFTLLFPLCCFAQSNISGKVLNRADAKPVADASVFLDKTSTGNRTEPDGTFTLSNVRPGKYELIVSIIGFETYSQTITVNDGNIALGDIKILARQLILNEVTVKATRIPDVNRQKYLSWFKDEFLGKSNLAQDCKIVNPEVLYLHFDEDQNILTASSSGFLLIENPDLGYKINYLLKHFSLNLSDRDAIRVQFEGSVLFEQMTGTVSKEQRWQKRRLDVYQNSSMHFLRAALNDRMEKEGFTASQLDWIPNPQSPPDSLINAKLIFFKDFKNETNNYRDSLSFWEKKAALPKTIKNNNIQLFTKDEIIKSTDQKDIYALFPGNNNGGIRVTYNKYHQRSNEESTRLDFRKTYVLFDNRGVILDPDGLTITGVWGRNRVAELLPVDYELASERINNDGSNIHQSPAVSLSDPLRDSLIKLKAASDSSTHNYPFEKLYLQFDKAYYALGDTIWFKAYLLNDYLTAADKSGIVHIDIANDSNKVIKQYLLPVQGGVTWGNKSLDEKEFATGTYTIRAYTNWTRNFGENGFFHKSFYVSSAGQNNLLANTRFTASTVNGNEVLTAKLLFSDIHEIPFAAQPLQLQVVNGNKHLYKQKLQTGVDGSLDLSFNLPPKSSNLAIIAENEKKDKGVRIPIVLNRPENADLQFLPEGGSLVAGLPAHIGFKAIGEDGKGINISGTIADHNLNQVAGFKSLHNGIGSFDLAVVAGETYTAKVNLPGGTIKEYSLPVVKNTGLVLKVINPLESESVTVTVAASNDLVSPGNNYFLVGKARGIICYAAVFNFSQGNAIQKKIAKNLFPTGITHFCILTTKYQPLNERLVFIDHGDNLKITTLANKSFYDTRDSVAVILKATDEDGVPVPGKFSMSVTDDAQVKQDTLNTENILTRLLLTSDLKGYVEAPGYYLSSKTSDAWQALDNLLLTQGWVGYDWGAALNPHAFAYRPETRLEVTGHVFNVFNKPVKGTNVLLFSKSPPMLMDTTTDQGGKFVFDRFPRVDTPVFVLKAVNKNGKSFNVGVTVEETTAPDFKKPVSPLLMPWNVNSDTTLLNYNKNSALTRQQANFRAGGHLLKEVNIKAKKIVHDSQNLNGPGEADIVLDEKDLEAAGKKNLLQLLQENIKGFREGAFVSGHSIRAVTDGFLSAYVTDSSKTIEWYFINGKPVKVIVDGISAAQIVAIPSGAPNSAFIDMTGYLTGHSVEDVKGIEVIHTAGLAAAYLSRYDPGTLIVDATVHNPSIDISPSDVAFVEITTRGGHGPAINNTPGMYLYKPLPLSWPKQFYKPKYTVKDTASHLLDLRSTIDWEPNITTDANGEAKLWFYTADKPSTYTVTIEGTGMNGTLGYKTTKISVGKAEQASK